VHRSFGKYAQIDSALYYSIILVGARRRICSQSCEEVMKATHVKQPRYKSLPYRRVALQTNFVVLYMITVHIFPTSVSTVNESMLPTIEVK
jgi:predicted nucleic acid-binding Zn ribbon protein